MQNSTTFSATAVGLAVIAAGSVAYGPEVLAQEGPRPALEEIVVTAQKRSEPLADIPMSVTVLSGNLLERQQADNFRDLVAMVPGFSINTSTRGITRITLRGINTGGVASTVGVYVDDVPFGSSSGLANAAILSGDFDTFDLARVEVLRGPQGTLYGASSLGGVLKYVPNPASTEAFEARFKGAAENVADGDLGYSLTGLVNVPVSDRFAVRATGFYRFDDGYIDSIGNNPIPSLTDPSVNIVEGTRVEEGVNSLDTFGGRVSALFQPSDRFSVDLTALWQNLESDGSDVVDADPVTLQPLNSDPVQSRYHPAPTDIEYRLYSATMNWDFGLASLESITSYSTFEEDFQRDLAIQSNLVGVEFAAFLSNLFGTPLSAIQQQVTSTDKFTQELRLVSPEHETFEWLIGAYYTEEDSGIDPQNIFAVEAGTETIATDVPTLVEAVLVSEFEELALFANATWFVTPRFELSFGARASENDQVATQVADGVLVGGLTEFEDATSSESPFTYSFSPRFQLTDNASIYARVATGYRAGGPNVLPPAAPPDIPRTYDSDTLTSYEVGFKSNDIGGVLSLDLTAYYLDWEDIQLLAVVNNFGINGNGGTAESRGLEVAASVVPMDGLSVSFNGAYTDASLTQDTDPIVGGLDGDPLSYVPEWSFGLGARYEWSVMGESTAHVGGNLDYTGDRPTGFDNRAPDGSLREAESYVTVDLRAGIDTGRWSFEVYGKNLTDETVITSINSEGGLPNGAVGLGLSGPRTIGLSVGASF